MTGFDVIGDVHGHADRLRNLLARMGYTERHGVWAHPDRTAVFLGDLIDRGPGQLDTLQMVRAMVAVGSAQIVLGNHEFNAVAYATRHPERDDYCRPHNDKHTSQHEAFLADVAFGSPLHRSIIDWFTTIPLWLDLGGLRVVHACWSTDHIDHLEAQTGPDNTLTEELVIDATTEGTPTHDAVETVLKGPEVHLDGVRYRDKDGHPRDHARLRWWDSEATTLRNGRVDRGRHAAPRRRRPTDRRAPRPPADRRRAAAVHRARSGAVRPLLVAQGDRRAGQPSSDVPRLQCRDGRRPARLPLGRRGPARRGQVRRSLSGALTIAGNAEDATPRARPAPDRPHPR